MLTELCETIGRVEDLDWSRVEEMIGRELTPVVEQLIREIGLIVVNTKELAEQSRGVIRIAALPSISSTILPRAVARFKESYPGISVVLKDVLSERLFEMVKAEEVDYGIGSVNRADPDLEFTLLMTDRIVTIFPPGHSLEQKKVIELKDLVNLPLILMDKESGVRRLVDRAFEGIPAIAKPAYEATYMSTAAGMVRAGLGVALLPSSASETGELTGLRSRPIRHPALTREIGIIQRSRRSLSPAAEGFLGFMKAACKKNRTESASGNVAGQN